MDDLLEDFDVNSGADESKLGGFSSSFGFEPPVGYLDFLRRSNGGEGYIGKRYLMMWPLEELAENNLGYKVAQYAPGLFLFGSSGGGEAYGFDLRSAPPKIVSVPFIPLSIDHAVYAGSTFQVFLQWLAAGADLDAPPE